MGKSTLNQAHRWLPLPYQAGRILVGQSGPDAHRSPAKRLVAKEWTDDSTSINKQLEFTLLGLVGLSIIDAVIPIPIVALILVFVIVQKSPWFQKLVDEIYKA